MPAAGRVILTYGRSLMALVIARSLARRGVEVIGCDDLGLTVLSFSKHVKETFTVAPWESEPEQFLTDLETAVLEYAPHDGRPYVLMPVFREIELITRHRDRFEPAIKIAAPRIESIELTNPKDRLAVLTEQHKLDAPRSWRPKSMADVKALGSELPYPVIIKPVDGVGGRGVSLVKDAKELASKAEAIGFEKPPLLQGFVDGEDYCVAALADGGELKAIMAYRNLFTFPREAGAGAARETVDDAPFRDAVAALMRATQWDGLAQVDFRWSGRPEDKPQIIEINARYWAGIFHSIETGPDFPWLLYQQTLGHPIEEVDEPDIGAKTKTPGVWLAAAIEDVAASDAHFAAASRAWREAKRDLKHGKVIASIEKAGEAIGATLSVSDAAESLRDALRELKDAPSELSSARDPLVGLGALFVLSSLVRHGKLPPEVTYRAPEAKPAEEAASPTPRKRPIIGVTKPASGDTLAWWAMKLSVWLAGGDPVKITARAPRDPQAIDGLIFGGGADVYPVRYEAEPKPNYAYDIERGDMEMTWAAAAREHDLPVLGVCRGAQMLNVAAGGTLHMDLSSFKDARGPRHAIDRIFRRRPVRVRANSRLADVLRARNLRVNAIHEQAIDRLGAGLVVSAREPNGVIQGIEDRARRFWIGVQFHPEFLIYRPCFLRLFKQLVAAARERAAERAEETQAETASVERVREPA